MSYGSCRLAMVQVSGCSTPSSCACQERNHSKQTPAVSGEGAVPAENGRFLFFLRLRRNWLWVKTIGTILGVGAPPLLGFVLVGIGMFTGGTIWFLTHGQLELPMGSLHTRHRLPPS